MADNLSPDVIRDQIFIASGMHGQAAGDDPGITADEWDGILNQLGTDVSVQEKGAVERALKQVDYLLTAAVENGFADGTRLEPELYRSRRQSVFAAAEAFRERFDVETPAFREIAQLPAKFADEP